MSRVAERTEVGIVRRGDVDRSSGPKQPVKFFHRPENVGDVFNHVNSSNAVEGSIGKRVWKSVQIAEHIGSCARNPIDSDGARILVYTTADVEDPRSAVTV